MLWKGGGVATPFNSVYQCKELSYWKSDSSEYIAMQLRSSCQTLLVTAYRPPKYSTHFFDDFATLLSAVCIDFSCVAIVGDYNIHIDNSEDSSAKESLNILEDF